MDIIRIFVTSLIVLLMISLLAAAANAALTERIHNGDSGFIGLLVLIIVSFGFLLLSIPAIIYLAIFGIVFTSPDSWIWNNGTNYFVNHILGLGLVLVVMWGVSLPSISVGWLGQIFAAISPSKAARQARGQIKASDLPMLPLDDFQGVSQFSTSKRTLAEETQRENLAAELERTIAEMQLKKARLEEYERQRRKP